MAKSNKKSKNGVRGKGKSNSKSQKINKSLGPASINKQEMATRTVKLFEKNPNTVFSHRQIANEIGLSSMGQRKLLTNVLDTLVVQDFINEPSTGRYRLSTQKGTLDGVLERHAGGKIFFVPQDGGEEVFILDKYMNRAIVGDLVRVRVFATKKGQSPEGQVIEVLKRGRDTYIGKLDVFPNYAFLQVDHKLLSNDIFIPIDKLKGGKSGDKAVVRIVSWENRDRNPVGEVVEVLGPSGDNEAEMHAILMEFGLPYSYPQEMEDRANEIPEEIPAEEYQRRLDCREIPTFTIDPADAKDFDDALSLKRNEDDTWQVGVHIADVSHYVKSGSRIDEEAYTRGTSVYLVDRVLPMLPEELCNDLCSLRPHEDKLCMSVVFTIDENARVLKHKLCRTVICSNARLNYDEAQEVIASGNANNEVEQAIVVLNRLAIQLRAARMAAGALMLEQEEMRFRLDEKGNPVEIYFEHPSESHHLIEEFMLLANRTVAKAVGGRPFVYRIHDIPDEDKLSELKAFKKRMGDRVQPQVIDMLTIRAMAKAVYSTFNIGHYGLAFSHYTHFTSPIRRYPDLMVHRLLDKYILTGKGDTLPREILQEMCDHCSVCEQEAQQAERESNKMYQAMWMADHVGEIMAGHISGVTDFGLFVQLDESRCEGLIHISTIGQGEYWQHDDKNYRLVAEGTKNKKNTKSVKSYTLGDAVRVKVTRVDVNRSQVDFVLVENE
jgi:ribonuclease R